MAEQCAPGGCPVPAPSHTSVTHLHPAPSLGHCRYYESSDSGSDSETDLAPADDGWDGAWGEQQMQNQQRW